MASEAGIAAVICNGTTAGTLAAAAAGERGRDPLRAPRPARRSSFKLWLKYAKPARGRLVVDAGAARVLREQRLEPAAGRDRRQSRAASTPATRSSVAGDGAADRQGDQPTTRRAELAPDQGLQERRTCASCFPTRPTRSSTATASSCSEALQLPFADGCDRRPPSPRAAPPRSARRGRWRAPRPRRRTPPWRRPRGCSKSARAEILEANAGDLADERAAGLTEALRDRLTLTAGAGRGDGRGRAGRRRARRPGRRGARTQNAGERPRPAQGAGAARGRRRRLRGAAERDDRLRGADDQERQRDRPARLQLRRALERGAGGGRPRGARRGGPARGRGARCWPAAATTTWPSWRPRRGWSTC